MCLAQENRTVKVKVTEAVVIRDCWWNNTAANVRDKTVSLVRSGHLITSAFHQTASLCVCLCVNSLNQNVLFSSKARTVQRVVGGVTTWLED